MDNQIRQ